MSFKEYTCYLQNVDARFTFWDSVAQMGSRIASAFPAAEKKGWTQIQ
jgi:hypothetical protein